MDCVVEVLRLAMIAADQGSPSLAGCRDRENLDSRDMGNHRNHPKLWLKGMKKSKERRQEIQQCNDDKLKQFGFLRKKSSG